MRTVSQNCDLTYLYPDGDRPPTRLSPMPQKGPYKRLFQRILVPAAGGIQRSREIARVRAHPYVSGAALHDLSGVAWRVVETGQRVNGLSLHRLDVHDGFGRCVERRLNARAEHLESCVSI